MPQTLNILPARFDFAIRRGDTFRVQLAFVDLAGAPIDLSDVAAVWGLVKNGTAILTLTAGEAESANGQLSLTGDGSNIYEVFIPHTRTATLDACRLSYYLKLTLSNNDVRTVLEAAFTVSMAVPSPTLQTQNLTLTVPWANYSIRVQIPINTVDVGAYLDGLPDYPTNEDAEADGVPINGVYWVSVGSDAAVAGTLMRRTQ